MLLCQIPYNKSYNDKKLLQDVLYLDVTSEYAAYGPPV